jgi:sec-independent protein translocase protein TatA
MGPSWWQIAIVVLLFVLLFGRGKISDLMGDVAKGIKSFKSGLEDEDKEVADTKAIQQETTLSPAKSHEPEKQKSS